MLCYVMLLDIILGLSARQLPQTSCYLSKKGAFFMRQSAHAGQPCKKGNPASYQSTPHKGGSVYDTGTPMLKTKRVGRSIKSIQNDC